MMTRWTAGATTAGMLAALALAGAGCASDRVSEATERDEARGTGGVALALSLPNGIEVTSVRYTVTRNGVTVSSGSIPVGADGRASTTIGGLEAGSGYLATLQTEGDAGAACAGQSSAFVVLAGQTTNVGIVLACGDDGFDTTVVLNGSFDVCPRITGTSLTPALVTVGAAASITATAVDRDGHALSYMWSASAGTFAPANTANTSYTCTSAGQQTLTLRVTDTPGCTKQTTLTVQCGELDGGTPDSGVSDGGSDAGVATIQILGFNDFHGNVEPPSGSSGTVVTGRADGGVAPTATAGGASYFAQHIAALRAQNPNTVVVSAGDLIGASPLVSALFHDEPTIEAMNLIGLDIGGVGNHEFDEGRAELLRMQYGGCHPVDGCQDGTPFAGATFKFLASNVLTDAPASSTLFDRYTIRELDGVKIAFIGMTLEATPTIVTPSGVAGLTFLDEADTVNAIVPQLQAQGVQTVVVVIHEGGFQTGLFDECVGISGEIKNIVERLHEEVDLVISGHTHAAYNCVINGKRVTSALSFGRLVTQVQLDIDRTTQDVVGLTAVNRVITRDVTPVAEVEQLVSRYVGLAAPLRDRVIGSASMQLTRSVTPTATNSSTGESTLGDVIADAQRAATLDASRPEPQIAFMNPGGVRADLDAGSITYGEAFTIQPFGNSLVALTLTGAQIDILLEQQFSATATRILHPSANVSYTFDFSAPIGSKVSNVAIEGVALDPTRSYRVTVNSFLATGGDGFLVLNEGTGRVGGDVDVDALERYLLQNNPILPPAQTRIMRIN